MALTPKVLRKGTQYLAPIWKGENTSGCTPIGDKVLILPYLALEQTEGGVHIPNDVKERMQLSAVSGVIVALGDDSFTWSADRMRPFGGYKPQVGDHVYFERYAGAEMTGDDGIEYRLVDDKSIGAVLVRNKA